MNTFKWLLKREYWEHRGGFFWTPFWISATILILTLLGVVWAEVAGRNLSANINIGIPWSKISSEISSGDLVQAGQALDVANVVFAGLLCVSLFFVLFFYLLGALYDDRKDRSVLFWKSLPISDTSTVLSKVVSATLVAPLIAFVVATVAYLGFLLLVSIWTALHGLNPLPVIANSNPFGLFWRLLLTIPVDALWALPTVGWLLLCSSFARSKPFLWAVLLPIGAIIVNSWIGAMGLPNLSAGFVMNDVAGRLIFSIVPGSWLGDNGFIGLGGVTRNVQMLEDGNLLGAFDPAVVYRLLGTANLWIGVAAGSAMIALSIWMRRRRIESSV